MKPKGTADFFISYTKKDKEWAQWIAWELEKERFFCVLQARDFVPGGDFIQQMNEAIKRSKQVIAVFSPDYFKSRYASAEMNAALALDPVGNKGRLVPVRVRECQPSGLLRGRVYIDLVDKSAEVARQELLEGIRASQIALVGPEKAVRFNRRPFFPGDDKLASKANNAAPKAVKPAHADKIDGPLKILFLASEGGMGLDVKGEFKKIKAAVEAAKYANSISLSSKFDLTAEDMFESLDEQAPHVMHFSGRMDGGAILLESNEGGLTAVKEAALKGLLRALKDNIRLVVLNTCKSLGCARSISKVIDCVIGIKGDISDEDAIWFSETFYSGLASGRSVKAALERARAALSLRGVPNNEAPELVCREGVNPAEVVLAKLSSDSEASRAGGRVSAGKKARRVRPAVKSGEAIKTR